MGDLQVKIDQLRETARFASIRAESIEREIRSLHNTVGRELLHDGWQGSAASAYDESWLEWKAGADKIVAALHESSDKLLAAAAAYEAQEYENTSAIQAQQWKLDL